MKRKTAFLFSILACLSLVAGAVERAFEKPAHIRALEDQGVFIHQNAITKEIWQNFIIGGLFKANAFLNFCFNADEYVLQGKVVHIPQAGAASSVTKNRSALPATISKRTDTDVTYPLDEYTTDPKLVGHAETVELSYDKMESVMQEDMAALRETVADNLIIAWCPTTASQIIRTTGTGVVAHLPSATGNRKKLVPADFKNAMTKMNGQSIPMEERYALISAQMYDQLVDSFSETQYKDFSKVLDVENGIVGQLYGFKIIMRPTVAVYNNAGTPAVKAYGAAGAATDNDVVLCWQRNAVERALGEVVPFHNPGVAEYYGDVMSFLLRMGGRIRRSDEKGVIAIVQDASA